MSVLRVAYWSPLPPQATGVADYSAALLPHLANRCDIEVFVDEGAAAARGGLPTFSHRQYDERARRAAFDVNLYQMGNNHRFHAYLYPYLLRESGVTVLHDVSLLHFSYGLCAGSGGVKAFLGEVEQTEGAAGVAAFLAMTRRPDGLDPLRVPMNRKVIDASRAVITHSRWARGVLAARSPAPPVHHVPFGVQGLDGREGHTIRHALGWAEENFVVGAFGLVQSSARAELLLRAFARLHAARPTTRLLVVGPRSFDLPPRSRSLLTRLEADRAIHVAGRVPSSDFDDYLLASDVVVSLRHPTAGGTSSVMMGAFGAGRPVVISDAPQLREFAAAFCLVVPVDEGEEDALVGLLARLADDPAGGARLGAAAQRYARACHGWRLVADRYAEVLTEVAVARRAG